MATHPMSRNFESSSDIWSELNEQQAAAATFEGRNLLVLAGAGTGKTRTIIARAKYLLDKGVPASRILILSFTRKIDQGDCDQASGIDTARCTCVEWSDLPFVVYGDD